MNKVTVDILNHPYDIEVAAGEELTIYAVADYLNQKFKEVQRDTGIVDTQKLAIFVALNIADEYFRLKNSRENVSVNVDKKAEEMIKALDRAMTA